MADDLRHSFETSRFNIAEMIRTDRMLVLKLNHHLLLPIAIVLTFLILVSCTASGEYEITTFDLGKARSIEILASNNLEVSQSFYYQVKVDQKIVVPLFTMCNGIDRGQLKFKTLFAKGGEVVGIFEQTYPGEILAIHDFSSNASWPNVRYDSPEEHEQFGERLLKQLQAEHQNIRLGLGPDRACG